MCYHLPTLTYSWRYITHSRPGSQTWHIPPFDTIPVIRSGEKNSGTEIRNSNFGGAIDCNYRRWKTIWTVAGGGGTFGKSAMARKIELVIRAWDGRVRKKWRNARIKLLFSYICLPQCETIKFLSFVHCFAKISLPFFQSKPEGCSSIIREGLFGIYFLFCFSGNTGRYRLNPEREREREVLWQV